MIAESSHYDMIIIGSGPAGQNAALEAANRSARVLVIEQELQVGGACVQYGTIPSKTLRETALTLSAFQRRSGDVYRVSRDAVHALGGTSGPGDGILPTGIYTIPEIATIGLSEQQAIEQVRCPLVARVNYNQVARAHIAASSGGLLKMIADEDGRKILGLQIVGDNATELIHLGQMAMIGGMPVDTFIHNTFNFPTMAEAYRLAAMEIVHQRESRMPPFATRCPAAASAPPC